MIGTIIWAIVGGAIIGMLARLLLPGKQDISVWLTIAVGIAAALLGGVIAQWLGVGETRGIDWIRHIIQVALAMLFVWLAARYTGGSARRSSHA
jgi:uncharacterized membrane protein YeaQ/YmgE (transglycosylase-associated protein family)